MLDGPNWGQFIIALQAVSRILDKWDAMRGEVLTRNPTTYDLLEKPTTVPVTATAAEIAAYLAAKTVCSKKNVQGLGLIHASVLPVIWQEHNTLGTTKEVLDALETTFGAVGGGIDLLPVG